MKEAVAADKFAINHEPNDGNIQFSSVSSVDEISDSCSYDGSSSEVSSKVLYNICCVLFILAMVICYAP